MIPNIGGGGPEIGGKAAGVGGPPEIQAWDFLPRTIFETQPTRDFFSWGSFFLGVDRSRRLGLSGLFPLAMLGIFLADNLLGEERKSLTDCLCMIAVDV